MILLVVSEPNNFHVYLQDFSTIDENSATSSKARAVSVDSTDINSIYHVRRCIHMRATPESNAVSLSMALMLILVQILTLLNSKSLLIR